MWQKSVKWESSSSGAWRSETVPVPEKCVCVCMCVAVCVAPAVTIHNMHTQKKLTTSMHLGNMAGCTILEVDRGGRGHNLLGISLLHARASHFKIIACLYLALCMCVCVCVCGCWVGVGVRAHTCGGVVVVVAGGRKAVQEFVCASSHP